MAMPRVCFDGKVFDSIAEVVSLLSCSCFFSGSCCGCSSSSSLSVLLVIVFRAEIMKLIHLEGVGQTTKKAEAAEKEKAKPNPGAAQCCCKIHKSKKTPSWAGGASFVDRSAPLQSSHQKNQETHCHGAVFG